ncbi:MAG TPA: hypothetical protein HPP87_11585, partial [Planctomycetes bacterium]|nr:hypothetical protein [Planctomycetota bacterium]
MKSKLNSLILLVIAALTFGALPVSADLWYVDGSASGNGTSWAQAFETIAEAVAAAADTGDEIWVKAGIYAISSQIQIDKNVGIYGGFAGNETERSQRDWVNNITIIDGQDTTRILKLTDEPIIDGFTLTRGYYEVTEAIGGGGAVYMGGIGALDKTARIRNCIISDNTAQANPIGTEGFKGGGAIYIGTGNPIFTNCLITNNSTNAYGGAANFYGGSPRFNNCTISKNTALKGGGLYLQGVDTFLNAQFYNCIVRGNIGTSDANDVEVKAGGDDPVGNNNCSSVAIG